MIHLRCLRSLRLSTPHQHGLLGRVHEAQLILGSRRCLGITGAALSSLSTGSRWNLLSDGTVSRRFAADAQQTSYPSALQDLVKIACHPAAALTADHLRVALAMHKNMPSLSSAQESLAGQQLLRVILSYEGWLMPTSWQNLPDGPQRQHGSVPAANESEEDARLLPLACDEKAFSCLISASATREVVQPLMISGAKAVADYFSSEGSAGDKRLRGLVVNWGESDELVLGSDRLQMLRIWESTLRLEALLLAELNEGMEEQQQASHDLARVLATEAKLYFVRTPDNNDLARDGSGRNILVLTSLDAAAACAAAYGKQQLREVASSELRTMAEQAEGVFGYALTMGPDRAVRHFDTVGEAHAPMWHNRVVSAEWLVSALSRET